MGAMSRELRGTKTGLGRLRTEGQREQAIEERGPASNQS